MPAPVLGDTLRARSKVDSADDRSLAPWTLCGGIVLFLTALVFFYFSVLRLDYRKSPLLDLQPGPDAMEYFAQARALAKGRLPLIEIGRERLPSAFPPGYSAMMIPWLKLLPERKAVLAPFRTSQTAGVMMLVVTFAFYFYLGMPLSGGVASLLLGTLPGFWTFARSSMSDTSSWLLYALAAMFAYLGLKQGARWKIYLSAFILGLSMNVRLQSVFFFPLLLAMPLFPLNGDRRRWFCHCVGAGLVFLVAASPYLLLNIIEFGSPFKIGGSFWYPPRQLFSFSYIPTKNVAMFWDEFTLQPIGYFAANIFGTGTVFVPALILLILAGVPFIRSNRATLCLALTEVTFLVLTAMYLYPDGRYYLQLIILLLPVAVLPVVWAIRNLLSPRSCVAASGILLLFVAAGVGYPSRSGYRNPPVNRSQARDALLFHKREHRSRYFAAASNFKSLVGDGPGIVLSDIDPVYLNAIWSDQFLAAPIDQQQRRRWSPSWRYGREQAKALVEGGSAHALPIYSIVVWRKQKEATVSRLPSLAGYKWSEVPSRHSEVILKLVPENL